MKIAPAKNYKKPLYAIGIAAAIMTVAVTGCTEPVDYAGNEVIHTNETQETSYHKIDGDEVILGGEAELPPDYYDMGDDPDETEETARPVELGGAAQVQEPYETT